jgi:hypothetical protein
MLMSPWTEHAFSAQAENQNPLDPVAVADCRVFGRKLVSAASIVPFRHGPLQSKCDSGMFAR